MPNEKTVQKPKLTLAEAAEQWSSAKRAHRQAAAELAEAAPVILAHLQKTGRKSFKGVAIAFPSPSLVLDQPKVKEFLGKRLREFQKTTSPSPKLDLLEG